MVADKISTIDLDELINSVIAAAPAIYGLGHIVVFPLSFKISIFTKSPSLPTFRRQLETCLLSIYFSHCTYTGMVCSLLSTDPEVTNITRTTLNI